MSKEEDEKELSWEELKEFVKGKMLLIGLVFYDKKGNEIDMFQTHGIIQKLDDEGFFHVLRKDMSIYMMPHDNETFMHDDDDTETLITITFMQDDDDDDTEILITTTFMNDDDNTNDSIFSTHIVRLY